MTPREKWSDERLDDLQTEMREGFSRVDKDIRELRTDMNNRFEALNRTLIGAAAVIVAAVIGSNATLIAVALL